MKILRRTIHPEIKVIDAARGTVEYIASDETVDSYREAIKQSGWQFNRFQKNAPFVDSHNYESIECLLGKVVDFQVKKRQLVETVQWAVDVPECPMAKLGFAMTQAGYLKAVSVGFIPLKIITPRDPADEWNAANEDIGLTDVDNSISCIYLQQEQIELSACVVGANGNAVAKSYKAGILTDADLDVISSVIAKRELVESAVVPEDADPALLRARIAFLVDLTVKIANSL
jgi:hypothetical protein